MLNNVLVTTDTDTGERFVIAIGYGAEPLLAHESHPNFKAILAKRADGDAEGFADLFDIPASITKAFARLSEQVTVKDDTIFFDGDPVHGVVEQAILDTMNAGENVGAIVNFYEKLSTNPLGDVREGVYTFLSAQSQGSGGFTLTDDGNILGYKSVARRSPEWREGYDEVYVPSRRGEGIVNGREVSSEEYIETVVGDTVEMPRSRVLHDLSRACGDGLHVGTYKYASTFIVGGTVQLVEFNPRDIVSYPDAHSDYKLRVCRYKVVDVVTAPIESPVWRSSDLAEVDVDLTEDPWGLMDEEYIDNGEDDDLDLDIQDAENDLQIAEGGLEAAENEVDEAQEYLDALYAEHASGDEITAAQTDLNAAQIRLEEAEDAYNDAQDALRGCRCCRARSNHGRGGRHSVAAEGRGLNPAQNPRTGQFESGRPGSQRDKYGRFTG